MSNTFARLQLHGWRQFDDVDIDLNKQITILTGQNGCGKTTLLNVLNRHFGWSLNFISTPYFGKKRFRKLWSDLYRGEEDPDDADDEGLSGQPPEIGKIFYSNQQICSLKANPIVQAQYQLDYEGMHSVDGLHIPSHRPVVTYNNVTNIPADPKNSTQEYQQFQQLLIQQYGGGRADNPGKIQKQSIISFALFGEGNSHVNPNREIREMFDSFQEVLRSVLPPSLGFQRLEVRMPEVVCLTRSGNFSLDAMSGGINAIFSIAWQLHMFGYGKEAFSITIDEPENHLHPNMQRTLLPSLARAFPRCSIVAATHSPFVVSSFPDANVYALVRNDRGRIASKLLSLDDVSGTPNEVLREILFVDSNLPEWVEQSINDAIANTSQLPNPERSKAIMMKLEELGIADAIVEFRRSAGNAPNN